MKIGIHLKHIRTERGMTLLSVAEAIGVTSGLLSQIENGKTSPSISTLTELLSFYRVPLSEFFKQLEKSNVVVTYACDVDTIKGKNGIQVSLLASKLDNNTLESYKIALTTDERLKLKALSSDYNGERFILVLKGSIEVRIAEEYYVLKKGDSLNFKSYIECEIQRNVTGQVEIFINGAPPVL
jgi:transcriptional regulator with XRE-family HTH domain